MADSGGEVCSERCSWSIYCSGNCTLTASSASCAGIAGALVQFECQKALYVWGGWFNRCWCDYKHFSLLDSARRDWGIILAKNGVTWLSSICGGEGTTSPT